METSNTPDIKSLPFSERPREKLLRYGAPALNDAELLAILFGSGNRQCPVMQFSEQIIIASDNDLNRLASMTVEELCKINGIGEAKALIIKAAMELGDRRIAIYNKALIVNDENAVVQLIQPCFSKEYYLQYFLVMCNNRHELLATHELLIKGKCHPNLKDVIRLCLEAGAARIWLCRNEVTANENFINEENAFSIELDAAASMLRMSYNGLIVCYKGLAVSSP
jgi:DNA repair protein RadC